MSAQQAEQETKREQYMLDFKKWCEQRDVKCKLLTFGTTYFVMIFDKSCRGKQCNCGKARGEDFETVVEMAKIDYLSKLERRRETLS